MKKKDIQNEELDEEIIDEEELLDDDEVLDDEEIDEDDEIIDDDEDEEAPKKTKAKKNGKTPMKKGTKIAIISSSSAVAVIAIALIVLFVVLPAVGIHIFAKKQTGDVIQPDEFNFKLMITGYEQNPTQVTSKAKITAALTYDADDMAAFYASTDDKNLVAAQMIFASYVNISTAHQYSFFKYQIGTTNLGDNTGTLLYQRMRRQNKEIKDDTTLKLPINHNFNSIAVTGVTGEGKTAIRYIKDHAIYRIVSKTIDYDSKTGLLSCDSWKKGSNYGDEEEVSVSANITEARANYLSLVKGMVYNGATENMDINSPKAVFKKSPTKIQDKGDYYEIYVETDSTVASKDSDTLKFFKEDNGATNATITKCNITIQIWKCGLIKEMYIDEEWSGKIAGFSGVANSVSKVVYSYTDDDCNDDSKTEAIWKAL